jgi:SAM-dependent methyltransferase
MIILGLDPGLGTTGWGVIHADGNRLSHVANGQIKTDPSMPLPRRLSNLHAALIDVIADLTPGRVLDVGCGEGADAVWLARQGWDVTALEVSGVALQRAAGHARDAGVAVRWVHAGLVEAALPPGSFDLVSGQYPALSDVGTGVSAHVIAKAFDLFLSTQTAGQGTGLGPGMIHGFARQSGGQVRIYSEAGQRTTVCL